VGRERKGEGKGGRREEGGEGKGGGEEKGRGLGGVRSPILTGG